MDAAFQPPCSPLARVTTEPFRPHLPGPAFQSLEYLGAEITELWGHLNAATYRFLALIAEFDRREGWVLDGVANCAQWLNWQCGIGAVAAREKVRVARSLSSLPKISDAFRRGVISYSKVRAMTRVATPANEDILLNVAEHGTAAHVERLVRKYARVERLQEVQRSNEAHRCRSLFYFYDEDGSLVIRAKLPAEVGAMVQKALDAAVAVLERDEAEREARFAEEATTDETAGTVAPGSTNGRALENVSAETSEATHEHPHFDHCPWSARRADALRLMAETFLARQSEDSGSAGDRYQVVVHINQSVLARAGAHLPIALEGGAAVCELEDGAALAAETVRRLACDCSTVGMLDNEDGEPLSIGRKSRSIPPALQRALKARDGGCRFPGCGRTRFTEGHHITHWAEGGETKLSNLVTLCRFHHRLVHEGGFGLHATDDAAAHDTFVFTRPDGTRVAQSGRGCFRGNYGATLERGAMVAAPATQSLGTPSGEWPLPPDDPGELPLFALNRDAGLDIHWRTSRSQWCGESMDYNQAIQAMLQRTEQGLH